LFGELVNVLAL